jgi:hypothetical protein
MSADRQYRFIRGPSQIGDLNVFWIGDRKPGIEHVLHHNGVA